MVSLELWRDLLYILEFCQGCPFKFMFVHQCQYSCVVIRDTSGIFSKLHSAVWTLLVVRRETKGPFPIATGILGFLSIFKKSQASSPFKALNSA